MKDSKTKAVKDPSSEQSDEDWKAVLRAVLLADCPSEDIHRLNNLELTALVKNDAIAVSQNITILHTPWIMSDRKLNYDQ